MPRASKLSDHQWQQVRDRLLVGETTSALAREFGIDEAAIRKRFGSRASLNAQRTDVRAAAMALAVLAPEHRSAAITLGERLANVSTNLASAAELGSATAHRLHALANAAAAKIDDADPVPGVDPVRAVAALTATANAASSLPLGLLSANRGTAAGRLQEGAGPKSGVLVVPGTMDEAAWEAMARSAASEQQPSEG